MIINKKQWNDLRIKNELLLRIIHNSINNAKALEYDPVKDSLLEVTMFINGVECDIEASTLKLNAMYKDKVFEEYNKGVSYGKEEAIAILASKFTDIVDKGYTE